jgi:hypothetical protein
MCPTYSGDDTASFFHILINMDEIFIIIENTSSGFNLKSYASFNRLCKDNKINKDMVSKDKLPFKVGNLTIMKSVVNTKI